MSHAYVGIDPGITGAIGVIRSDGVVLVRDVPTYTKSDGKKAYNFYEMYKLLNGLVQNHDGVSLTLEQQQAMPKQGVASTFQTGRGYGAWEALCWVTTPDFSIVSPRKWKKALGLTQDKERSRAMARKLYPVIDEELLRKRDHNRAEAILLAHYTKLERTGEL